MNKTSVQVNIELLKAKPISFQINKDIEIESDIKISDFEISMNIGVRVDEKKSNVGIKAKVEVFEKNSDIMCFILETLYEFNVSDLDKVTIEKGNKIVLKPEFAKKLFNISIGGTRGMLVAFLSNTQFEEFVLPIANIPDSMFE